MVKLMIIFFSFFMPISQEKHNLEIKITGISQVQGSMMIAIYQPQHEFLGEEGFYFEAIPVKNSGQLTVHTLLPEGKYAISIFHDLNSDGELNTNLLGIPKEPYGFSITRGSFGPPSFEEASFLVSSGKQIEIEIK